MKPPPLLLIPHSYSFFILWVTLVITINVQTSVCDDDGHYTNCHSPFSCGNSVTNLKYPFWGENRESYCGESELEINCEDSVPKLTIHSNKYRILRWENTTQTLTVARDDYWNDICVTDYKNDTFDGTPFQYNPSEIVNVMLLYNCDPSVPQSTWPGSNCNGQTVYYGLQPSFNSASASALALCTSVVILANQAQASLVSSSRIIDALEDGFTLKWTGNYEECNRCMDSGGECGIDGGFTCFCKDGPHTTSCDSSSSKSSSSKAPIIAGAVVGVVALVAILGCAYFVVRRRRKLAEQSSSKELFMPTSSSHTLTSTTNTSQSVSSFPSSNSGTVQRTSYFGVQVFTYEELEEATKNFDPSRELGEGGFGTVYKGELKDGRVVAVKRLYESSFKRVEQFMNEVKILAGLRHKNLVTLYGCTSRHSRELLLVYEFISNGTVSDHLQGERSKSTLVPWSVRMNIAIETAEALAYLHKATVIHRDVKSNNILLDDKFRVKVADFGLSRLFPTHVTHVSTAPQGTPGYVDPEYYQCYQLTDKSDVYSFGVVLIELISSLQAVDINRHRNDVNLANMAINKIQNQELHELIDPSLGFEKDYAVRRMTTAVAELAFRCLQQQREMRPSMDEVLETLEGIKSDELGAKNDAEVLEIRTEEIILLKKDVPSPHSPDSVVYKWVSSSSASNSS